uniref:Endo-1,4-beta-xylanase A n=1 Tax=Anthurium amnicola TaxID=1678845 RepID=A0A1D1YIL8_9ARAE
MINEMAVGPQNSLMSNIILNHDFSGGLHSWHPNSWNAYVVQMGPDAPNSIAANSGHCYAVVTRRTECWQGLEQEITEKVSPGSTYIMSACVRVWGAHEGSTAVQATLKLEHPDCPTRYISIGRTSVSTEKWEKLEGTFCLSSMPKRVVLYLEGPPPGVDLLIDSVMVFPSGHKQFEDVKARSAADGGENIIQNPNFEDGLRNWSGRGCKIFLHDAMGNGKVLPSSGKFFASATQRTQCWNGIQQEITGRVQRKLAYEITGLVRIFGTVGNANVDATLWVQSPNGREQYIGIAKVQARDKEWVQLQGKFLLNNCPSRVVVYLEGPPSGIDILVNNLVVRRAKKPPPLPPPDFEIITGRMFELRMSPETNIILNPDFSEGLHSWHPNSCNGYVISGGSAFVEGTTAKSGGSYAVVSNRTESWQGLEQDITDRVAPNSSYNVSAWVRVYGGILKTYEVQATIKLEYLDSTTSFMSAGRVLASKEQWVELEGSFLLMKMPKRVVFFLEGPPPGVDVLIDSVTIASSSLKKLKNVLFGENIIENSNLSKELNSWYPKGSCTLKVCTGSPHLLPSVLRESLVFHRPLSGHYILATNRAETWMGPAQTVTERLKLHLTYQVSAWVRVGAGASGPQTINVVLGVDNQWVNGGHIEVNDGGWHELAGSFRIENQPKKVLVYVQGPSSGVDLMIADLQIFPVDRIKRFKHLNEQTDKVRKRDVILKFSHNGNLFGSTVKVRQIKNSFPFGSCISRSNIDNEEFSEFFVNNFNWAVFGNELKWNHTEPQRGNFNYADADEMLDFCERHGIETRGHCIFWEVEHNVQSWVRSLSTDELMKAVQHRLAALLSRYRGRFKHYDVNNEMLHGSFYQSRLGSNIWSYMFKVANQIDPSAVLFVNDYHVEDGCDPNSSPEKYIQQIFDLREQGAPVGGIGIQGHINCPVGPIICSALDKLAVLGLPIWFTELDVSAVNEHVRADDLEVVLREAYAHPAVEGIVLWGFWETFMFRDHSHLVDAEGEINEAGKRYLALKQEWLSNADGPIDAHGEFRFRGFHGTYNLEITTPSKIFSQIFVVDQGESPLVVAIHL